MTNADRIRNMTDGQLAEMFHDNSEVFSCGVCKFYRYHCDCKKCTDGALEWLKLESTEEIIRYRDDYDRWTPHLSKEDACECFSNSIDELIDFIEMYSEQINGNGYLEQKILRLIKDEIQID